MRRGSPRRGVVAVLALLALLVVSLVVVVVLLARARAVRAGGATVQADGSIATRPRAATVQDADPLHMPVKPTPVQMPSFHGCPPEGDSRRMRSLNLLKNRVDVPAAYREVPLARLISLPWPRGAEQQPPAEWTRVERDSVGRWNGIPVVAEGYIAGARRGGAESANCHGTAPEFRDWRIWLVAERGEGRAVSLLAEPTPRVRLSHPGWTLGALGRARSEGARVRVSGWLFFDPEHPDQLGKTRGTLWEIHPVTRIEVQRRGEWVSLDGGARTAPPPPR